MAVGERQGGRWGGGGGRGALAGGALRRDPGNGEWPISRILAHMAVMAQRNGLFIYQMATMTDPARAPLDEDAEAGRLQHQNPLMLVDLIEAELGKTIALLSHTPDASWGRPGRKNGLRRSLRQEVETHGKHMHEHLDSIGTAAHEVYVALSSLHAPPMGAAWWM